MHIMRGMQRLLALVAAVFGIATFVAGGRVLLGSNPGYVVYLPLLVYNTAMGVAYVAAGIVAWFSVRRGKYVAATIFALNAMVLAGAAYLYSRQGPIAIESVGAMTFRTAVWLALFLGFVWLTRGDSRTDRRDV